MDTSTRTGTPLRQRMTEDMRMRKLQHKTQQAYLRAVRKLTVFLKRSPNTVTVEDLCNFQLHLVDSGTSPITLNATLSGLRFFFDTTLGRVELMARMQPVKLPRTAALGGHVLHCEGCGTDQVAYNSCRNRHGPKCQSTAAKRWLDARQADLLPVEYYHVVFTLPAPIADIAYQNRALVYGILFDAAEVLETIAADPKHLGARIGATLVLHTWGLGADAPPSCARHRARRRTLPRRHGVGGLPAGVLPAGARAAATVPAAFP